jgi:hypothetical protein
MGAEDLTQQIRIWTSPLHFTHKSKTLLTNAFAVQGLRLESVACVRQRKKSHTSETSTATSSQGFVQAEKMKKTAPLQPGT